MTLAAIIKSQAAAALEALYPSEKINDSQITVSQTKPEFSGDYTIVLFPFEKSLRMKPDALGSALGEKLMEQSELFSAFSIVSGFLNLTIKDSWWTTFLLNHFNDLDWGLAPKSDKRVMIEYSSPNTNKPLHFGHLRNNFLGFAIAGILKAGGRQVIKANLVNDRGIHICKSMIAWQRYGNGASPESANTKGDHLVGDYYVRFNDVYKEEIAKLVAAGTEEKEAEKKAPIYIEAQEMLRLWEAGDKEVYALWQRMNGWVYEGFEVTYKKLGIDFDVTYHESNTYLLGKEIVQQGLERGALYNKEDGSVWIDLTAEGLDHKLLLRADGTSVYMTQDIGTAVLKHKEYRLDQSIYVIGDEQNYHMQVLKLILTKLNEPSAAGIEHLSYGMVELPTGKMKSREGTVVDADDMIEEMTALAQQQTEDAGKTEGFSAEELVGLYDTIGLGALKFYLLRVDPKKKMIFDPKESIDLHGYTATFVQYAHARICSVLRKMNIPLMPDKAIFQQYTTALTGNSFTIQKGEKDLLLALESYPQIIGSAAAELNPSLLCSYAFSVAQLFNTFYSAHAIAAAESDEQKAFRTMLIVMTAQVLRGSTALLGIRMPEKM